MEWIAVGLIGLVMLGGVILGPVLGLVTLPWFKFATKVQTNQQIITKTYDADNVIYNYEWFKNTYEAINADKEKIKTAKTDVDTFELNAGARSTWTFEDKTEDARLHTVLTGLQNHYQDLVAQYNARAKMTNRSIFQDNLPLYINL